MFADFALTESAGLEVSSYGYYYKAGISESEGLRFSIVLETAVALNAPTIRVWAGNSGFASVDSALDCHSRRRLRATASVIRS
jgi:hypothetical protein